jgi:cytoskeletal protein RodZ
MALNKKHGLCFLFTMLVIILIVNPRSINQMYNNILGRVGLIALIIFCAMNNVTLGLLVALCVIIATNMYKFEGFDNASIGTGANIDPSLIGTGQNIENLKQQLQQAQTASTATATPSTDTTTTTPSTDTTTTTPSTTPSTTSSTTSSTGVDRESVKQAIQSKSSNTMGVNKGMFSSTEVAPTSAPSTTTQDPFSSMGAPY